MCRRSKHVSLDPSDYRVVGATNLGGVFRNGVHHWLDLGRRAGDDAQDFTRRGLLLQRLGEFRRSSAVSVLR